MEQEQFESDSFLDDEDVTYSMNSPYQKMEEQNIYFDWNEMKIKQINQETVIE